MLHLFMIPIEILVHYGYVALFLWSIMEGEIGLMLSGWLSSRGEVFTVEGTILVAIAGALIGDTSLFLFGKLFEKRAKRWLAKERGREEKFSRWFNRWGAWVIVFERFIYGTHIPALLTIGVSGYSFLKFLIFDIIGIILWAVTFVYIGYYWGESAIDFMIFIQKNLLVFVSIVAVIIFILVMKRVKEEEFDI